MTRSIEEFAERLKHLKKRSGAWELILNELKKEGVSSICYAVLPIHSEMCKVGVTRASFYKTNHPDKWINKIGPETLLDNDITTERLLNESGEFIWHNEAEWENANDAQKQQASLERKLKMQVGVTIGIENFTHNNIAAGVGLCMSDFSESNFDKYWEENSTYLRSLAELIDKYYRRKDDFPLISLSCRELELLHLASAGYIQRDMAEILHKSQGTIEANSKSIRDKLKTNSLSHALIKAGKLNLIKY